MVEQSPRILTLEEKASTTIKRLLKGYVPLAESPPDFSALVTQCA